MSEFAPYLEFDAPIGRMTSYRVGGPADRLFRPETEEQLAAMTARARSDGVEVRVLGGGSNVLVRDEGVGGVVVRLDGPAFGDARIEGSRVTVGVGAKLMVLCRRLSERGLSGLEGLAGIPGSVGGAIRMNAGGREGSFGDVVREIRVLCADGSIETWSRDQVGFGYRCSAIGDRIALSAVLELEQKDPAGVSDCFRANLAAKNASQPTNQRTAGCVFKNPEGASAGALIDKAGLKGVRCGQASVSRLHANFIVTHPGARASDVLDLIDRIRGSVHKTLGVELGLEIEIW